MFRSVLPQHVKLVLALLVVALWPNPGFAQSQSTVVDVSASPSFLVLGVTSLTLNVSVYVSNCYSNCTFPTGTFSVDTPQAHLGTIPLGRYNTVSFTVSTLPQVGNNVVTVTYSGDAAHLSASSSISLFAKEPITQTPVIDFSQGFSSPTGIQANGSASVVNGSLQMTDDGQNEAGSAFFATPVSAASFTTSFTFQQTSGAADGLMFVIQNAPLGAKALGGAGGSLGYSPSVTNSVAVKFDLYDNQGEGSNSTGLYTYAPSTPSMPSQDLTLYGINLHSGDPMAVTLMYDGTTLSMTIVDVVTSAQYSTHWQLDIPRDVGGNLAYVGFTGATGGLTAVQQILNWTYTATLVDFGNGFGTHTGMQANGSTSWVNNTLQLTDGGRNEASSAFYTTPLSLGNFTTSFTFQLTDPMADGIMFVIQNGPAGPAALGGLGGALGYFPSISNSLGIKFDLYSNLGELEDTTGVFLNGANPVGLFTSVVPVGNGSGVNFHTQNPIRVTVSYDSTLDLLTFTILDTVNLGHFSYSYPNLDLAQVMGSNFAYFGFTGATGDLTAVQRILNWTYASH